MTFDLCSNNPTYLVLQKHKHRHYFSRNLCYKHRHQGEFLEQNTPRSCYIQISLDHIFCFFLLLKSYFFNINRETINKYVQ